LTEAVEQGAALGFRSTHRLAIVAARTKGARRARIASDTVTVERNMYIMRTSAKIILVAIAALSLLAMTAGTAAALRSLTWSKREIALLSRALTLKSFATVICEVSLNTTLNSLSIPKREGTTIGRVGLVILSCQNGATVTVLNTPWNLKYKSIAGTLPAITGLTQEIERAQFRVVAAGLACLVTAEVIGTQAVRSGTVGNLSGFPYIFRAISVREFCNGRETWEGEFAPLAGPVTLSLA